MTSEYIFFSPESICRSDIEAVASHTPCMCRRVRKAQTQLHTVNKKSIQLYRKSVFNTTNNLNRHEQIIKVILILLWVIRYLCVWLFCIHKVNEFEKNITKLKLVYHFFLFTKENSHCKTSCNISNIEPDHNYCTDC